MTNPSISTARLPQTETSEAKPTTLTETPPTVDDQYDPKDNETTNELNISSRNYTMNNPGTFAWTTTARATVDDPRLYYQYTFDKFEVPGGPQEQDGDPCPNAWVMILKGNDPTVSSEVILDKTCNANKDINLVEDPVSNKATTTTEFPNSTIYFKNDGNAEFEVTRTLETYVKPPILSNPRCMWDCQWRENKFFRKIGFWRFGGWGDNNADVPDICGPQDKDYKNCIKIYFSSPKIPRNLSCLEDCFDVVKEEIRLQEPEILKCFDNNAIANFRSTSDDEDIDCLLDRVKEEPSDDRNESHNHVQGNDLADRAKANSRPGQQ